MSEKDNYYAEYMDQPEKQTKAFEQALENRRFEIDYYWKRTTYFWTLIAAALTGYFVLFANASLHGDKFYPFCIACLGLLLSLSWVCANKGSKFWQENWENHVACLSQPIVGPLFHNILVRSRGGIWMWLLPTRPSRFSVSKINQRVSLYVVFVWSVLLLAASPLSTELRDSYFQRHCYLSIFCPTFLFIILVLFFSRTGTGKHTSEVVYSPTEVVDSLP